MVPTRLLLEGADLESLLARVRNEYGPDAHIVSAERVRSGGLGGLFAKDRYELTVEVSPEEAASPEDALPPEETVFPEGADPSTARHASFSEKREEAAGHSAEPQHAARDLTSGPASMEDLVAMADTADTVASFAEALASAQSTGTQVSGSRTAPPTVRPIRSSPATVTFPAAQYRAEWESQDLEDRRVEDDVPAPPAAEPAPPTRYATPHERPSPVSGMPSDPSRVPSLATRLVQLGVPVRLAARATGPDTYSAIANALSRLPSARVPPPGRGEVLVVVGDLAGAASVAQGVLSSWRLDPEVIAVAGPHASALAGSQRLTSQAEAGRWAAGLRVGDTPGIALIELDLDTRSVAWAQSLMAVLGPTAVWAAIDATRKTADCARWLEDLGRVDALAVHGTSGTGDPASVLSLDSPVAMLDGLPATPHTWAALLCQRLTESRHATG